MVFTVTVDRDEDGVWVVECPSIPGCVSQGKTKDEALENIKDAIKLCLEVRGEKALPFNRDPAEVFSKTGVAKVSEGPGCGLQSDIRGGTRKVFQ